MTKEKRENILLFRHDAELFFRVGIRYANREMFDLALKYFKKAIEAEPDNSDYQFNYGCVLAELKQIKESNSVLMNILRNIDPTLSECFFGIGCNYFEMGNLKRAKKYFEKYVDFDNEGEFAEEAHDILYYLEFYEKMDSDKADLENKAGIEALSKKRGGEKGFKGNSCSSKRSARGVKTDKHKVIQIPMKK